MEFGGSNKEEFFSKKVRAGKRRTYFFDVRATKGNDYYVTITESKRRFSGDGYERHKLHLYKEDFNKFIKAMEETVNYVKTELMPDYDFDEFTRREEEYLAMREAEEKAAQENESSDTDEVNSSEAETTATEPAADDEQAETWD